MFFQRYWQNLFLPSLQPGPDIKAIVKARDRMRVGTMVIKDKEKKARPKLKVGEAVRGQGPKPYIWGDLINCKKEDKLVKVGGMDRFLHMSTLGNLTFKLCNSIKVSPNLHGVVLTCTIAIQPLHAEERSQKDVSREPISRESPREPRELCALVSFPGAPVVPSSSASPKVRPGALGLPSYSQPLVCPGVPKVPPSPSSL